MSRLARTASIWRVGAGDSADRPTVDRTATTTKRCRGCSVNRTKTALATASQANGHGIPLLCPDWLTQLLWRPGDTRTHIQRPCRSVKVRLRGKDREGMRWQRRNRLSRRRGLVHHTRTSDQMSPPPEQGGPPVINCQAHLRTGVRGTLVAPCPCTERPLR